MGDQERIKPVSKAALQGIGRSDDSSEAYRRIAEGFSTTSHGRRVKTPNPYTQQDGSDYSDQVENMMDKLDNNE